MLAGAGRFGLRRPAVADARDQLSGWADRWRPLLPHLPNDPTQLARVAHWFDDRGALWQAFDAAARRTAEHHHPESAGLRADVLAATTSHDQAAGALRDAYRRRQERLEPLGLIAWTTNPQAVLADLERELTATHDRLAEAAPGLLP